MSNTLTGLFPVFYQALDRISRELVGFIPSVSSDMSVERVAKDQTIRSPITPKITLRAITPGAAPGDYGDDVMDYVDMSISNSYNAPVRWNGDEQLGLKSGGHYEKIAVDRFTQAMRALVNQVEADLAALYYKMSRGYGTAGVTPFASDFKSIAQIKKILDDNGTPNDGDRFLVIDTSAGAALRSLAQLTNVNQAGSEETLRRGILLDIHGFKIRESAQIKTHSGGDASADTVDGAHDKGDTVIALSAFTAGDYLQGDVITIDSVNYVVASADATANEVTIQEPGLVAGVESGAAVTLASDYAGNMAFHRSAIHLATRAPAMPEEGDAAADVMEIQDPVSGLGFQVAMYKQYRQVKYEVGLAWGVQGVKPEHGALLLG